MKKSGLVMCVVFALACIFGMTACGGNNSDNADGGHVHQWTVSSTTATCGEAGVTVYECECGESKTEVTAATGKHSYGDDSVCDVCGYVNFGDMSVEEAVEKYGFYVSDKDANGVYGTGDEVYFGSYPQSKVTDEGVLASLESEQGELPSDDNEGDWTAYEYYSQGVRKDYMYYKDVTVSGVKYRGVYMSAYRPYYASLEATAENSHIDDEGYELDTVYWFRYEPIAWKALEYKDGSFLLAANSSIDAQPFQTLYEENGGEYVIPGTEIYVNDWKESSVREFLNSALYETAFGEREQSLIQPTSLDNSSTGYSADGKYLKEQVGTLDNVFLLSYGDVANTAYGYSGKGSSRTRTFGDYAVAQGLRTSVESSTEDGKPASAYMLRSASENSLGISTVSKTGTASHTAPEFKDGESVDAVAVNGDAGVLPALYIRVGKTATGVWKDFKVEDTEFTLYMPASYAGGDKLGLITYIADSSYATATLEKYKVAQCPKAWLTEEKMAENPVFCLIICGSPSGKLVVDTVEALAEGFAMDTDRLYLTGQSMGGITDFAVNDEYPDMFAATVYVDCQPGGEVHDEQYDAIIANARFANQKFVYIASRKDELASQGQDDVQAVLDAAGQTEGEDYGLLYDLDHKDAAALNAAIKAELDKGMDRYFFGFTQLTSSGNTAAEHMQSFQYGYSVDAIFEWLMAQHK